MRQQAHKQREPMIVKPQLHDLSRLLRKAKSKTRPQKKIMNLLRVIDTSPFHAQRKKLWVTT